MLTWFARWLTPPRLRYAWITAGVLWAAWLLSVALGPGNLDLAGQPVGTDYLQFYAAGRTLACGESARLYDRAYQAALEKEIIGPGLTSYHAFITPPFLAWFFVPLVALPYGPSFAVWSVLGLVFLWCSLCLLGVAAPARAWLWALTFFPVFAVISFGQNALLSLLLFSVVYRLWTAKRPFLAGLACSLTLYKPQLCLGVTLLWLINWRRDWWVLVGLGVGGAALAASCFLLLPEASWAYVDFARTVLPDLPHWQEFPLWHLHTVRGFWRLLLPAWPRLGDGLTLIAAGFGVWGFVRWERRFREQLPLVFGGAMALTLWLTPHAMIYDWALLLIPALALWEALPQNRDRWRPLLAVLWIAALLSGPLTVVQLRLLPVAVQVSVPFLAWVLYQIWRWSLSGELLPA